jgi:hypothetical protein
MTIGPPFPRNVPVSKGRLAVNHPTMGRFSIPFQYNPDKVTRSLSLQATGIEGGLRSKAPAFRGAATETITLQARFEALPPTTSDAAQNGVLPQLAALELLLYPPTSDVQQEDARLDQGSRSIQPSPLPVVILEWGQRAVPVRLRQMVINEEMFDSNLNPVQASAALTFDVVTYSAVTDQSSEAQQFLTYQRALEQLAKTARTTGA